MTWELSSGFILLTPLIWFAGWHPYFNFFLKKFTFIYLSIYLFNMWVHMPLHACGDQRTTSDNRFFPSFMWALSTELTVIYLPWCPASLSDESCCLCFIPLFLILLSLYESKPTNQINKNVISSFSRIIVIHSFSSSVICPCWSWFDVFESEKLCRESQYPELEGIVKAQVDVRGNLLWGFWASSSTWTTITSMFSCTPSPGLPGLWIGP